MHEIEPKPEKWNENIRPCGECGIQWAKIGKQCPVCYTPDPCKACRHIATGPGHACGCPHTCKPIVTPSPEPPEKRFQCLNHTTYCRCMNLNGLCKNRHYADCLKECQLENDGEKGESLKCEYCGDTEKDSMGFLCLLCLNLSQLENEFCDLFCPNFGHEDHNAKNNGCATSADNVDLGEIMKWIKTLLAAKERCVRAKCKEEVYNCPHQYWSEIGKDDLCYKDFRCDGCGLNLEDYSHKDFVSTIS